MRAAPPVTCQAGLQGLWLLLALGVWLAAGAVWLSWLGWSFRVLGPAAWAAGRLVPALLALLMLTLSAVALHTARRRRWTLHWTGAQWQLQETGAAGPPRVVRRLELCVDLGDALLLRARIDGPRSKVCWLPIARAAGAPDWGGLRVALLFQSGNRPGAEVSA